MQVKVYQGQAPPQELDTFYKYIWLDWATCRSINESRFGSRVRGFVSNQNNIVSYKEQVVVRWGGNFFLALRHGSPKIGNRTSLESTCRKIAHVAKRASWPRHHYNYAREQVQSRWKRELSWFALHWSSHCQCSQIPRPGCRASKEWVATWPTWCGNVFSPDLSERSMWSRVSQKNQKSEFCYATNPSGFHRLDEPPKKNSAL